MNADRPMRIQRIAMLLHPITKKLIGELLLAGYSAEAMGEIFSQGLEIALGKGMNEIADAIAKHKATIEGN